MFIKSLFKKKEYKIDMKDLPVHLAIIMDGNGRWARKRGLSRSVGHREGSKTLKRLVLFCSEIGIKHLTVFAFSTENWKRPKKEVNTLMSLMHEYLKNADRELKGKDVRIRVFGDLRQLPDDIQKQITKVCKSTQNRKGMSFNIALNYGGRSEIVQAVKKIANDVKKGVISVDDIDEQVISDRMYTLGIPEPDLLIRSSGEKRLSNFMLWQLAYTELWFSDVLWPDFTKETILQAFEEYQQRKRRYGGI